MSTKTTMFWLVSLAGLALAAGQCQPTEECDPAPCLADTNCSCSGWEPDVPLADRPQIVYLSFDGSLSWQFDQGSHSTNSKNYLKACATDYYTELFESGNFLNPDGCPIRGTFFLAHMYNDYTLNHKYWALGNEIASKGITNRSNVTYWSSLNVTGWTMEVADMRRMTNTYANIPNVNDIQGMRAPFLQVGGNNQFEMMQNENFIYDSSMPTRTYGYTNMENGWWPYSLDYTNNMDCQIEPCPTCSFPGVWEQPILQLEDNWYGQPGHPDTGSPCSMLDGCIIISGTEPEDVLELMQKNFNRSYYGNTRAPIGFHVQTAWFVGQDWHFEGYKMFLDYALAFDDVYIVPIRDGIEYMKNPVPVSELPNFEPFGCDNFPVFDCPQPQSCRYTDVDLGEDGQFGEMYMMSCVRCPVNYPWLGNVEGN